jgi:hypothetical protein
LQRYLSMRSIARSLFLMFSNLRMASALLQKDVWWRLSEHCTCLLVITRRSSSWRAFTVRSDSCQLFFDSARSQEHLPFTPLHASSDGHATLPHWPRLCGYCMVFMGEALTELRFHCVMHISRMRSCAILKIANGKWDHVVTTYFSRHMQQKYCKRGDFDQVILTSVKSDLTW